MHSTYPESKINFTNILIDIHAEIKSRAIVNVVINIGNDGGSRITHLGKINRIQRIRQGEIAIHLTYEVVKIEAKRTVPKRSPQTQVQFFALNKGHFRVFATLITGSSLAAQIGPRIPTFPNKHLLVQVIAHFIAVGPDVHILINDTS